MWHTSRGDRTLQGHEANLIRLAVKNMVDALRMHLMEDTDVDMVASDCETGISLFDNHTPAQRIALLHDVSTYLLTDTPITHPLTAAAEATVAAIFAEVRDQVAIEIEIQGLRATSDSETPNTWRQAVMKAWQAESATRADGAPSDDSAQSPVSPRLPADLAFPESDWDHADSDLVSLDPTSCDLMQWEWVIEYLVDELLWDRDFELGDAFMDVDPNVSQHRRRLMGIDDGYFTAVPPDPRPEQLDDLIRETLDIVRAKPR